MSNFIEQACDLRGKRIASVEKDEEKYGEECWELDALDVAVMADIIEKNVTHWRDDALWEKAVKRQEGARQMLKGIHDRWNEVVRMVKLPPIDILQQPIRKDDYDV